VGNLVAIDGATGDRLWAVQYGFTLGTSPVVSNGIIYVATEHGAVVALDVKDGALRWSFEIDAETGSSPVVADGMVFLGTGRTYREPAEGFIYAIGDR
jgi:outer membrane protein assembly factor BamB